MKEVELRSNPNKQEQNEYFLKEIDVLLNVSEEIPERMIDGSQIDKDYKVRTNWFAGVVHLLEYAINKNMLEQEFRVEIKKFIKIFKSRHINDKIRTTYEEIEMGNQLLRKAKNYIENKQ